MWTDTAIFDEIAMLLPYAEACFPLLGENSPGRYLSEANPGIATTTDGNYLEGFRTNDTEPPTQAKGSFGPSFWYENFNTNVSDAFVNPTSVGNFTGKNNPYSYQYRPSNQVNKPKGVFCVPSVGSQVWVFHYRGDLNFPVYIGGRHDFRGNSLITDSDSPQGYPPDQGPKEVEEVQSLDYPGVFENLFGGN